MDDPELMAKELGRQPTMDDLMGHEPFRPGYAYLPPALLGGTRTSYDDALSGRWCDNCQKRVKLACISEGEWRAFNPDTDDIAFCADCHDFIGEYWLEPEA